MKKPQKIILIRHGESEANVDRKLYCTIPDHDIKLTEKGREQAVQVGKNLEKHLVKGDVSFLCSTHMRAKETLDVVLEQLDGARDYEIQYSPLIREQERGFFTKPFEDYEKAWKDIKRLGKFYYRFPDGESGADVHSRATILINRMLWEIQRGNYKENLVLITHNFFIKTFLMSWAGTIPEMFDKMEDIKNGEIIVLKKTTFSDLHYSTERPIRMKEE